MLLSNSVHFSSERGNWETPQDFFDKLNEEFRFTLDVCAEKHTAKCEKYFTKEDNALDKEWHGICWMNPPYGRGIGVWLKKAYETAQSGSMVVCLIPFHVIHHLSTDATNGSLFGYLTTSLMKMNIDYLCCSIHLMMF